MKNDGTYFLLFRHASSKTEKHYPPQVYPFEWNGIEFFVHRLAASFEGRITESKTLWGATHKETGALLPVVTVNMASAKKAAIDKLEKAGVDKIRAEIKKFSKF